MKATGNPVFAMMAVVMLSTGQVGAQAKPDAPPLAESPFLTTDRTLQASLDRVFRGSALWREAVEAVKETGRRAVLVTADTSVTGTINPNRHVFAPDVLAEAMPLFDQDGQIGVVLVFVNVPLLTSTHDARLSVRRQFEADLDRIVVHELYGHAIPYLLAGDLSGRCADPRRGERPSESCSIRRENAVRTELGLGRRGDAGLSSLTLAWGRLLDRD